MIAGLYRSHPSADFAHDACAFMAEHAREDAFAIEAVQGVGVGVADAGRHDFDQHFTRLGAFEIELDDFERLLGGESDGGAGLHGWVLRVSAGARYGFVIVRAMATGRAAALAALQVRGARKHAVTGLGIAIGRFPARAGGFVQGVPERLGHRAAP